jgi:hypoxanthine phosphoribosyltransferase
LPYPTFYFSLTVKSSTFAHSHHPKAMQTITIHDRSFVPYLGAEEIQKRIRVLGAEIKRDMEGKVPLLLSVLNGSFMFAADLMKQLDFPVEISFVKLASYQGTGTTGEVKQLIGLSEQIGGRCVVIVEDIIDTGITMDHLLAELRHYNPAELKIATLLFKEEAFRKDFPIDYIGFRVPDHFLVGYGLDYDGQGRNYPEIFTLHV